MKNVKNKIHEHGIRHYTRKIGWMPDPFHVMFLTEQNTWNKIDRFITMLRDNVSRKMFELR